MPQAAPDLVLIDNQSSELGERGERVDRRRDHLQFGTRILLSDEHAVQYTGDALEANEKTANGYQKDFTDYLDDGQVSVNQRPNSEYS